MTPRLTIGIDLGGTDIKAALVSDDRAPDTCITRPTNADTGPDRVIDNLVAIIDELRSTATPAAVGIGTPGPLSPSRGVVYRSANLPGWDNVPLRDTIAQRTGLPVVIDNDANVAAYGQYRADPSVRNLIFITLGTGVGAGTIVDGRIFHGHYENASEWGHMIVHPGGILCNCGQRGCLEMYASAHNIARRVTDEINAGAVSCLCGDGVSPGNHPVVTAPDVVTAAREGDPVAARIWDEACHALAVACVNMQHALNPRRILFGGGMSAAGDFLLDTIHGHYDNLHWRLCDDAPELRLATLTNAAGIIGAAALARDAVTNAP